MTARTKIIAALLAGLAGALALVLPAPARAQDVIDGKTFPERQLEERNKERREAARESARRDPQTPLYVPGGAPRSVSPAPWNAPAPRSGGGSVPWNAK